MNPSEIRINNLVLVDNMQYHPRLQGIPLRVTGMEERVFNGERDYIVRLEDMRNRDTYSQLIRFIKPIELKENVFLEYGFRKSPLFGHSEHFIYRHPLLYTEIVALHNARFSIKLDNTARIIYNLHQLQNLFVDITTKELYSKNEGKKHEENEQ